MKFNQKKVKYKISNQKVSVPKAKFSRQATGDRRQAAAGKGNNKLIKAALLTCVSFLIVFAIIVSVKFQIGYDVYINNKIVGVIGDKANLDLMINDIETIVGAASDGENSFEIDTRTVIRLIKKGEETSNFTIRQNILALCPNVEKAYAIYVNDGLVCAARTESDAFDALNSVKEQYNSGTLLKIEFVDEAVVRNEYVPQNQILDLKEAKDTLNGKSRHRMIYETATDEELANIAQRFSMALDELADMNKNLDEIAPGGTKVNVLKTQSNIQVRTENIEEYEKEIGYATEEVSDNVLPLGSRVLANSGVNGASVEKATVIRINGQEQDRIPISEEVKRQPVNEIIKIGMNDNGEKPIISDTSWIWPIKAAVTSGFNPHRKHPIYGIVRPHEGIDLPAAYGASVRAATSGKVTLAAWSGDYGNCIRVKSDETYSQVYAHLSQVLVKEGQEVRQGQIIGKVGSTGASTAPHLHFEIRKNNVPINPVELLPKNK